MVQAIVNLGDRENRVLNIVKGMFGLKNKSEAINLIIGKFEEESLEPQLRPEYVGKLKRIEKEKSIPFKDIAELRRIVEG